MTLPFTPPAIWPEPATRREARAILIDVFCDDTAAQDVRDAAHQALRELERLPGPGTVLLPVHRTTGTLAQARQLLVQEDTSDLSIREGLGIAIAAAQLNPWADPPVGPSAGAGAGPGQGGGQP